MDEEEDSYAADLIALGDAGDLLRAFEQDDESTAELVLVDASDQKTVH